jgi:LysW-gamma-L-lysine/LysW-L-ornithine aminotransferase
MIDTQTSITTLEEAHTSGAYPKRPLTLVRGEGYRVWDEQGNAYLDLTSGQGVALLGHSHPAVAAAIAQQASTLITCPEIFYNNRRAELYQLLTGILPEQIDRFFLCNSGAEAIEGALKVARLLTDRTRMVAMKRGFHGRTLGALSLTWNPKYREPFSVWQPEIDYAAYDDIEAAQMLIGVDTAAVVVEAVQGEGGVYPASAGYLRELRRLCDETGALLVVDEIQTGWGRTGSWFAFEQAGIVPDVIALGKGMAGGLPMGAVAWRGALGTLPRSSHGSTFGGNPLACAAAIATITTLREMDLPQRAAEIGAWMMEDLRARALPPVREIRGRGLMIGLELRGRVTPVLQTLQECGILALPAGLNVLRLLPPLILSRNEAQYAVDVIAEVLS